MHIIKHKLSLSITAHHFLAKVIRIQKEGRQPEIIPSADKEEIYLRFFVLVIAKLKKHE